MEGAQVAEELRDAIVRQHGVAIGPDDPILMLGTAITHLINKQKEAQEEQLRGFREQMESFALQFGDEQKARAERILNVALQAAKDHLEKRADELGSQAAPAQQSNPDATSTTGNSGATQTALLGVAGGVGAGVVIALALWLGRFI